MAPGPGPTVAPSNDNTTVAPGSETTTTIAPSNDNTTVAPATTVPEPSNETTVAPSNGSTGVPVVTTVPGHTTVPTQPEPIVVLKSGLLAGAWIPFVVVVIAAALWSTSYIKFYEHKKERECGPTTVAVLGMTFSLITIALIPVDIYLVSQMKNPDGTFQDWAAHSNARVAVEDIATDGYIVLYSVVCLFVFLLIPLAYFYYEEKDEELNTKGCRRFFEAAKYA